MIIKDVEKVRAPIIYIAVSLVLSSICYVVSDNYLWLAVTYASLFFLFVIFETNIKFSIIILLFFSVGILFNFNYYNLKINKNFYGVIRVVEINNYNKIADYKGRKVYIDCKSLKNNLGDRIIVKGIYSNEVDKEKGTLGRIDVNNYEIIEKDLIGKLYTLRNSIYEKLEENLGRRKAALVSSLAFGYSDYLDSEDKEDMKSLGIIHAISVSGLHIVLIFSILKKIVKGKLAFFITIVYVLFTGAAFSSIRSLIMIGCMTLALRVRKKYNALGGLSLSAIIIFCIKPYAPIQIGFLLSFLATLGIIILSKDIEDKLYRFPKFLRENISVCVAAQTFTTPLLITLFREMSISFIIGNILVVPILNIIIIFGNLLIIFSSVRKVFDFISYVLLNIINILDRSMEVLYDVLPSMLILNEKMVFVYSIFIISMFYIAKGYKKFVILPVIAIIVVMFQVYSPILKIQYIKEGGLLITNKGERKIITNKRNIDAKRIKLENLTDDIYLEAKKVNISNNIEIQAEGKNFIILIDNKKYLMKLNRRGEVNGSYDIINFVDGRYNGIYILGNTPILY